MNNLATYSAPYIRANGIKPNELVNNITGFLKEINSKNIQPVSLKLRLSPPPHLENVLTMVGARTEETCYSEFMHEVDLFNRALLIAMNTLNGQGHFQPIPVYRLDENTQWSSETLKAAIALAFKYGTPHFEYKTPEPTSTHFSMMRGGGILSYSENTGLAGLIALNIPRIAHRAEGEDEYYQLLRDVTELAVDYLDWKHEHLQTRYNDGLMPLTSEYMGTFENQSLGVTVTGVHEALQKLIQAGIDTMPGKAVTYKTLEHIQDFLTERNEETNRYYTIEQTHLEETPSYFAEKDKKENIAILEPGNTDPFYTSNSQLPVSHGDDLWEALEHQQRIHLQYSGGTLFPVYLHQSIPYHDECTLLIQRILEEFQYQCITVSPTFSICQTHGHIPGHNEHCPICKEETTIYTQVSGVVKSLDQTHIARKEEYRLRVPYDVKNM
jgi:anaerobic ribonucleoside-triphosphate reductase